MAASFISHRDAVAVSVQRVRCSLRFRVLACFDPQWPESGLVSFLVVGEFWVGFVRYPTITPKAALDIKNSGEATTTKMRGDGELL